MNARPMESSVIELPEDAAGKDIGNLRAYLVNRSGSIIDTATFDGRTASIRAAGAGEKIYVAPALPKEVPATKANERTLKAFGAYQPVGSTEKNKLFIPHLPDGIFQLPRFRFFNVSGKVTKDFIVDGKAVTSPVCKATVHICTVQKKFIKLTVPKPVFTIPDWLLDELKYKFVLTNKPVIKKPQPDPGPIREAAIAKRNLSLRSLTGRTNKNNAVKANSLPLLSTEVLNDIQYSTTETFAQVLDKHHDYLYPYLCAWEFYWPWFYTLHEETKVITKGCEGNADSEGHYNSWFFLPGNVTTENIYVWIEMNINGQNVTTYRPPYPCHTRWNSTSGVQIDVKVTDTRVPACDCDLELPDHAFGFASIGDLANLQYIVQDVNSHPNIQGMDFLNAGCTSILGEPNSLRPFGGMLYFKVFNGININTGSDSVTTHFRWKATQLKDYNMHDVTDAAPVILNQLDKISRPFWVRIQGNEQHIVNLDITPEGSGIDTAFRIPFQDITKETAILNLYPGKILGTDITWDSKIWIGGSIDSTSLANGLYRFDLELGRHDNNGHFIIASVAPDTFQTKIDKVPATNPPEYGTVTPDAVNLYPKPQTDGDKVTEFTMLVRIDNASCTADIKDVLLKNVDPNGPDENSGPCGFLSYKDESQNVELKFEASHPSNFATFGYTVTKGNNTIGSVISVSGYVNAGAGNFNVLGGIYSSEPTVNDLLSGCINQAAFAEHLVVSPLATNGSTYAYGSLEVIKAFALNKVPEQNADKS